MLAEDEARTLRHDHIGTGHLLLGLVSESQGIAARVLWSFDVTLDEARVHVTQLTRPGDEPPPGGHLPVTPRAKKVLELSLRESLALRHERIGTEHLLLGLVRADDGVGARVLVGFGADGASVRTRVLDAFSGVEPVGAESFEASSFVPGDAPCELRERAERLRTEMEAAIAAQDLGLAARLREEERRVARDARLQRQADSPPDEWKRRWPIWR